MPYGGGGQMFKLLDNVSAVGASRCIKMNEDFNVLDSYVEFDSLAAVKVSAVTMEIQGAVNNSEDLTGVITNPTLAIDSIATKFANAAFSYRINGTNYSVAADSAGNAFTAAHVIGNGTDDLWGGIWVGINAAGTFVTRVPLTPQVYVSAAEVHAALDAIPVRSDLCYVGRIIINAAALTWTANSKNLTDSGEVTTATFISATSNFITLYTHILNSDEITAQKAMWHMTNRGMNYIRVYLSTLTGTGRVRCWVRPRRS